MYMIMRVHRSHNSLTDCDPDWTCVIIDSLEFLIIGPTAVTPECEEDERERLRAVIRLSPHSDTPAAAIVSGAFQELSGYVQIPVSYQLSSVASTLVLCPHVRSQLIVVITVVTNSWGVAILFKPHQVDEELSRDPGTDSEVHPRSVGPPHPLEQGLVSEGVPTVDTREGQRFVYVWLV